MSRTDEDIKRDVEAELRWDPRIDPTDIAVTVKEGVLTLAGFVRSYTEKYEAEEAVKRVKGVRGVANDIDVRLPGIEERPDPEIARDIVAALRTQLPYSSENITVVVTRGWATLEGEVQWYYQRQRAEQLAGSVRGVRGVTDLIKVKAVPAPYDLKRKIEEALERSAQLEAQRIRVDVREDGEVVLRGKVRSWVMRAEEERATWSAPGVKKVINEIFVEG